MHSSLSYAQSSPPISFSDELGDIMGNDNSQVSPVTPILILPVRSLTLHLQPSHIQFELSSPNLQTVAEVKNFN